MIYIQEAHPTDLWQLPVNQRDGVLFTSAHTSDERRETASACVRKLGLNVPALCDGINDATERAYTGWPDRLYLIGRGGRVLYKSAPGPFGFKPADLEKALQEPTVFATGVVPERTARP